MRLIRHTALAVSALALTGCGLHLTSSSSSDAPPSAPATASPSHAAASTPPATPGDVDSDGTSDGTIDGGSDGSSAAPTAGASASGSGAATAPAEHVIRYADKTGLLQLPVSNASIPDAPAGLRDFARAQLKQMWHDQFQGDPGCEGIAQVQIKRVTATAAYVEASWGATTPTCPQYAGDPGWWEVWGQDEENGTWSTTLKGQGLASCSDLVSHAITRGIYPTCSDGTKKVPNPVG